MTMVCFDPLLDLRKLHRLRIGGIAVLAALAGCSASVPDPFLTTQAVTPVAAPIASDVSGDYAAAFLPPFAGAIHSVRQTVKTNALHQEIIYANQTALAGENRLTIDVGKPGDASMLRPPGEAQLSREMRAALPGMAMTISPIIGDNASGPFGYATAANPAGGSCLYAWQYVRSVNPGDSEGIDRLTRSHLSASVRLRYCHPSIAADRIHVLMEGLRIKDMNSRTIDMLRFAAGTAEVAAPVSFTPPTKAVTRPQRHKVATVADDLDWRKEAEARASEGVRSAPADAITVPLPEATTTEPVTVPVAGNDDDSGPARQITDAAAVPLPE
jgi:hypothetical protein